MVSLDWSDCPLVEVIPGKVSGAPLLRNTRLPVEAITGNYDAFLARRVIARTTPSPRLLDCYPEAGVDAIKRYSSLSFRASIAGAALKVLFDEDVPRKLVRLLPGHDIHTVVSIGWGGVKNGALLPADRTRRLSGISHRRQEHASSSAALLVRPYVHKIAAVVDTARPGMVETIDCGVFVPRSRR